MLVAVERTSRKDVDQGTTDVWLSPRLKGTFLGSEVLELHPCYLWGQGPPAMESPQLNLGSQDIGEELGMLGTQDSIGL